ncbi:MAG: hypothetical protein ABIB79_00970 [archaeon]
MSKKTIGHYVMDGLKIYSNTLDKVGEYLLEKYEQQEAFRCFLRAGIWVLEDIRNIKDPNRKR